MCHLLCDVCECVYVCVGVWVWGRAGAEVGQALLSNAVAGGRWVRRRFCFGN